MKILDTEISPLGMGCWPIGGAMYSGDTSFGYTRSDDDVSVRTIHAALDGGITLFDTAAAYGAGHSERLLAKALKDRPDALIVTKIGVGIDERRRQISFDPFTPDLVPDAVDGCLKRLQRDRIDLLLLHVGEMPIREAAAVFDACDRLIDEGKIRAYGWSTDDAERVAGLSQRENFQAVEYAANLFLNASKMQQIVRKEEVIPLLRSPLAMGLLSGKYDANTVLPRQDVRGAGQIWIEYFKDGKPNPEFLRRLDAVREVLMSDGRTLVQGALCWVWGQTRRNIPIPGARTEAQIKEIAGSLAFGALPETAMGEIETLMDRVPEVK